MLPKFTMSIPRREKRLKIHQQSIQIAKLRWEIVVHSKNYSSSDESSLSLPAATLQNTPNKTKHAHNNNNNIPHRVEVKAARTKLERKGARWERAMKSDFKTEKTTTDSAWLEDEQKLNDKARRAGMSIYRPCPASQVRRWNSGTL